MRVAPRGLRLEADFQLGEWRVQPSLRQVAGPPGSFRLEPKAMDVLVHLAQRPDHIVTKDELLELVWKDTFVVDGALFRQVSELRRVLGDDSRAPRYIQTIPKRGYRLVAPLSYDVTGPTTEGASQDPFAPASGPEKPALPPVLPPPVAAIPPPARHRGWTLLAAALPLLVVLAFLICAPSQGARVDSSRTTQSRR